MILFLSRGCQREEGRMFLRRKGAAGDALLPLRRFGGNISGGIVELKDKNAAVGVERAAGGSPCFFEGFGGQDMGDLRDQARGDQSFLDVIALEVDVGINLMGYAVVALVALEPNVVGGSANPEGAAVNLERRLPDAQMVARGYYLDGLSMRPTVILGTVEEVQRAHRHRKVRFLGNAFEDAVKHCATHVGVHLDPPGSRENILHGVFGAKDEEIDHVAGIAIYVRDPARKLRAPAGVYA